MDFHLERRAITRVQAAIIAVILVIAVIAGAAYLTLPAPTPSPTPSPVQPIKIGLVLPLTGASARLGKEVLDGAMLAVEEINKGGGILGRQINVIVEDDEGKPDKCLAAVKKLIEMDKVDLLNGILHSGNVVAVGEYVASVGIPYLSPISSGPVLLYTQDPKKFRNFFTVHPYYDDCGRAGLKFLTDVVKAKTYMCIEESLTWSVRSADYLRGFASDAGIKCLGDIVVPPGCKDFSEAIMKVREANPDAVVGHVFTGAEVTLVRQIYEAKLPMPYVGVMSMHAMWEMPELLGEASDYLVFTTWSWNISLTEKTVPFFNKFYEKYGYRACGLEGPAGYDHMYFLAAAVEKAGTLEWEAVIKAYGETKTVGVRGKYEIDPADHGTIYWAPEYINGIIGQWIGGKPYIIWPLEIAERSLTKAPGWR